MTGPADKGGWPPSPGEALARAAPTALEPTGRRAPAPLRLARSLDESDHRSLVHIDQDGQVRSPTRYRLGNAAGVALSGGVALVGTLLYATLFGPLWGLATGVLFGGSMAVAMRRRRRMQQVAALVADGRLADAEALCRRTLEGRLVSRGLKAAAHQNLAVIATRRGEFAEALAEVRRSVQLRHRAFGRRSVYLDLLAYAEIGLLVNLGRPGEARARLAARGDEPAGDYLRLLHHAAELSVQFAEGRCVLDEDQLWDWSRRALGLGPAAHFLALCAWGHAEIGDREMAEHLLDEAVDRAAPGTAVTFPALWAWVEAQRGARGGAGGTPAPG